MGRTASDGARVAVRVQPRASRDEVLGWRDGVLRVRVTAPPVEGAANGAVVALVAGALGVKPSAVRLIRGQTGRHKLVSVAGLTDDEVRARLRGSEAHR
ncbi:MAG: DUF167 domain-containing protein [Candidatus Rokuibacteriota bacterium]